MLVCIINKNHSIIRTPNDLSRYDPSCIGIGAQSRILLDKHLSFKSCRRHNLVYLNWEFSVSSHHGLRRISPQNRFKWNYSSAFALCWCAIAMFVPCNTLIRKSGWGSPHSRKNGEGSLSLPCVTGRLTSLREFQLLLDRNSWLGTRQRRMCSSRHPPHRPISFNTLLSENQLYGLNKLCKYLSIWFNQCALIASFSLFSLVWMSYTL